MLSTPTERIPEVIMRMTPDGRYIYVSPIVRKIYAMSAKYFLGKTAVEVGLTGDPANDHLLHTLVLRCASEHQSNQIDLPFFLHADSRLTNVIHVPEFNALGEVESIMAIALDITDQYHLEQQLIKTALEFRTLAENSPDIIVRYDVECRLMYFNPTYLEIGQAQAPVLLGQTPLQSWCFCSPTAEELTAHLKQVLRSGESNEFSLATEHPHHQAAKQFTMLMVPEYDQAHRICSVLAIGRDVTRVRHMEAMLRQSEREFGRLVEQCPNLIVRYDLDCRRIYLNPAYQRETGILLDEAWLTTPAEIWKPTMPCEVYLDKLKRIIATGCSERIVLEWYQDDKRVCHDLHLVAEYDDDSQIKGVLALGTNITELKHTERQLMETSTQLRLLTAKREEIIEDERKRIAREIHDELGQLLSVLRLNLTTFDLRFGEDNLDLRKKTQKLVAIVDSATDMVRSLTTRLRPLVLNAGIIPAIEWLLQEYNESTEITSSLVVTGHTIDLDEERSMVVFRIIQESLTNIIRHAEASRVDVFFHVGSELAIDVCDNGKGFDPDAPSKQFNYGIMGMRERALSLQGTLTICSAARGGTKVSLRIPISLPENAKT